MKHQNLAESGTLTTIDMGGYPYSVPVLVSTIEISKTERSVKLS
jgi:hypothetical protein